MQNTAPAYAEYLNDVSKAINSHDYDRALAIISLMCDTNEKTAKYQRLKAFWDSPRNVNHFWNGFKMWKTELIEFSIQLTQQNPVLS